MKINPLTVGILVSSIFLLSSCKPNSENCPTIKEAVTPTVMQKVEVINAYTPEHVANLTKLVIALEKYKQKHRSYPISSNKVESWDYYFSKSGERNPLWLEQLAPLFIETIPSSTRKSKQQQYVYKSDGANYKLLFLYPDDCGLVKLKAPDLVDFRRGCKAYGFWTARAVKW